MPLEVPRSVGRRCNYERLPPPRLRDGRPSHARVHHPPTIQLGRDQPGLAPRRPRDLPAERDDPGDEGEAVADGARGGSGDTDATAARSQREQSRSRHDN